MIDHKKNEDTTSLNTLMQLSNYVGVTLNDKTKIQCFTLSKEYIKQLMTVN
jgi:hypothetical protein